MLKPVLITVLATAVIVCWNVPGWSQDKKTPTEILGWWTPVESDESEAKHGGEPACSVSRVLISIKRGKLNLIGEDGSCEFISQSQHVNEGDLRKHFIILSGRTRCQASEGSPWVGTAAITYFSNDDKALLYVLREFGWGVPHKRCSPP
jgi:hypothetical protein